MQTTAALRKHVTESGFTSDRDVDQQLVACAQHGDKRAFELLVVKYHTRLLRLLLRFVRDASEVEDVTQEAFIKAYRALPTFRGDSAFYTWFYRIGINTAKNYLVSNRRRTSTITEIDAEGAEGSQETESFKDLNTPDSELASRQITASVNQTLQRLPQQLRATITLREIEGLRYEEIA